MGLAARPRFGAFPQPLSLLRRGEAHTMDCQALVIGQW